MYNKNCVCGKKSSIIYIFLSLFSISENNGCTFPPFPALAITDLSVLLYVCRKFAGLIYCTVWQSIAWNSLAQPIILLKTMHFTFPITDHALREIRILVEQISVNNGGRDEPLSYSRGPLDWTYKFSVKFDGREATSDRYDLFNEKTRFLFTPGQVIYIY